MLTDIALSKLTLDKNNIIVEAFCDIHNYDHAVEWGYKGTQEQFTDEKIKEFITSRVNAYRRKKASETATKDLELFTI